MKVRANVSTTEEPDAGNPHVRVCGGGAGKPASLRLRHLCASFALDRNFGTRHMRVSSPLGRQVTVREKCHQNLSSWRGGRTRMTRRSYKGGRLRARGREKMG
ncbi:MAG: hypothetical protein EHM38_10800 [Geobacteraceae bacterium]|nr:MAG: hypothetical protein EHM38_10800 [Geobacteraceae bacterium]